MHEMQDPRIPSAVLMEGIPQPVLDKAGLKAPLLPFFYIALASSFLHSAWLVGVVILASCW